MGNCWPFREDRVKRVTVTYAVAAWCLTIVAGKPRVDGRVTSCFGRMSLYTASGLGDILSASHGEFLIAPREINPSADTR